jgi:hypothetical protein
MVLPGKVIERNYWLWLVLRLLAGLTHLPGSRGIRAVLAENLLLRRQLLVLRRAHSCRRSPHLRMTDRLVLGFEFLVLEPASAIASHHYH